MQQLLAAVVFAFLCSGPLAQGMHEAVIVGQPMQYMKDGRVSGCGVRLIGLVSPATNNPAIGFDVSFNLDFEGFGFVKGGGLRVYYDGTGRAIQERKVIKPIKLWIRAPGHAATMPAGGRVFDGQDPPQMIMYATSIDSSAALFLAVSQRRSVQVGVHFLGEATERVFYGVAVLSESESGQLGACISEIPK